MRKPKNVSVAKVAMKPAEEEHWFKKAAIPAEPTTLKVKMLVNYHSIGEVVMITAAPNSMPDNIKAGSIVMLPYAEACSLIDRGMAEKA